MKVSAKTKDKQPVTIEYDLPEHLEGLRKHFGDEVVNAAAKGAIVISLQAYIRRLIEKGKNHAEIQAECKVWKPDTRTVVKQTAFEKATGAVTKLSPEERKQLLAQLQAMKYPSCVARAPAHAGAFEGARPALVPRAGK